MYLFWIEISAGFVGIPEIQTLGGGTPRGDHMRAHAVVSRAVLVVAVSTGWAAGAAAEVIAILGTKVSIAPPPDFVLATQFLGVQNAELASSIMISELPAPVEGATAGFTAEGLLSRGMTLRSSEETTVAGRPGRLISVSQVANGAIFEKWMAVFGNSSSTVLVVATYPQTLASELRAPMRSAVLSATWKPDAKIDPFDGLPFRVRESKHLKIQNRMQNMLLLAHSAQSASSPSEPFAVVGASHSPVRIDDIELFARQRITLTAQIADLREIQGESIKVAGGQAYEITAKARDLKSGENISVYQLVLVKGDSYYLMQGMVGDRQFDDYLPEFRAIARSLEIR
jgi:hypothetical protein